MANAINGPWVAVPEYPGSKYWLVRVSDGAAGNGRRVVAALYTLGDESLCEATARLLAAAPDLRDLLERTLVVCSKYASDDEVDGLLDVIQHFLARIPSTRDQS